MHENHLKSLTNLSPYFTSRVDCGWKKKVDTQWNVKKLDKNSNRVWGGGQRERFTLVNVTANISFNRVDPRRLFEFLLFCEWNEGGGEERKGARRKCEVSKLKFIWDDVANVEHKKKQTSKNPRNQYLISTFSCFCLKPTFSGFNLIQNKFECQCSEARDESCVWWVELRETDQHAAGFWYFCCI